MDEVLARSGIFQGVDSDAAESLAKELEYVEARKGEIIFNEGDPGDSLYIVLSGKIKLGRRAADGRRHQPARGEGLVAEHPRREAEPRAAGEQPVLRVFRQ